MTDYRASVAGQIGALPPVGDAAALAASFADWRARAAAAPGAFEAGQQNLGADAQEYNPSDAELVAAEAGDRLVCGAAGRRRGDAHGGRRRRWRQHELIAASTSGVSTWRGRGASSTRRRRARRGCRSRLMTHRPHLHACACPRRPAISSSG